MKRTINGESQDSEDEVWNYKSTRQGPSQAKKYKKVCRVHKPSEGVVSRSPIKDHPELVSVVDPNAYYPVVDRNFMKRRCNRQTAELKGGKNSQKTKYDSPNTPTASGVSQPTQKSPYSQNPDAVNVVSTHSRLLAGHCPSCQAPFTALITDSPGWHAMQCLEVSYNIPRPECSVGASCASTILSHYQKYSHNLLALLRAGLDTGDSFTTCDMQAQVCMKSSEICSQRNSVTCSKRLNFNSNPHDTDNYPCPNEQLRQRVGLNGTVICSQQDDIPNLLSKGYIPTDVTNPTPKIWEIDENNDKQKLDQNAHSVQSEHFVSGEFEEFELCSTTESSMRENFAADEDGDRIPCENQETSRGNQSELDMFCDLSDVLTDVFGDETFSSTQPAYSKFSGRENSSNKPKDQTSSVDLSSLANVPKMNSVAKPSTKGGSQISVPSPRRFIREKIQSNQLVCTPVKRTVQLKQMKTGLINNTQQLSINMFFKKVNGVSDSSVVPNDVLVPMIGKKLVQDLEPCKVLSEKQTGGMLKHPVVTVDRTVVCKMEQSEVKFEYRASSVLKSEGVASFVHGKSAIKNGMVSSHADRPFRKCPFYKKIPNTTICVDAFSYGTIPDCNAYFLSHFHYDHYGGLTKNFPHPIYCSKVTANLVLLKIRVKQHLVHALSLNESQLIEGVEVTLLDANHCPGSVMFLFKLQNGQVILHTGDFRADPCMEQFPQLLSVHISRLFLDTTYCDPTYDFPCQKNVIQFAVSKTLEFMCKYPKMLVAVGTYSIGKEKIFLALAEALDCEIFATQDKKNILSCLEDKSLNKRMTLKAANARLHVLKMNQINLNDLNMHLESLKPMFDHLLAFEPTGWTHSKKTLSIDNLRPKASSRNVTIYAVPYSEHSSYSEMKRFVQFLQPEKIIPTVNNGNPASRKKMEELFNAWHLSPTIQAVKAKNQQIQLSRWLENV